MHILKENKDEKITLLNEEDLLKVSGGVIIFKPLINWVKNGLFKKDYNGIRGGGGGGAF